MCVYIGVYAYIHFDRNSAFFKLHTKLNLSRTGQDYFVMTWRYYKAIKNML